MTDSTMNIVTSGLISFLALLIVLTFHEFAHAWVASKCGDDTARLDGRVSLNPVVHMDPLGTVVLPLLMVFLPLLGFPGLANWIIGWGKPVPVNPGNLRHRRLQDTLIAVAGPAMNLVLAGVFMLLARGFASVNLPPHIVQEVLPVLGQMTFISLLLCFFNLLPIPPLDGSHILKNFTGMREETYYRFAQYGFILVILAIQVPPIQRALNIATNGTFFALQRLVGLS